MRKYFAAFGILFFVAFSIRVAAIASWHEEKSLIYYSDSVTYLQVAKNILEHGVISMEHSPTPHPDNFRTPLYPLYLIPFVAFGTSLYVPVLIQCFIASLGFVLIFWLARQIFTERVALVATLVAAAEPFTALINAQVMTEALFTLIFIVSLLLFSLYIKNRDPRHLYVGSGLLALAALTRPVAFYLFICIIGAGLLVGIKNYYKPCVFGLGIFFLIVSPWLYFNHFVVKTGEFSSLSSFDMYAYHGKYFDAWRGARGATDRLPEIDLMIVNRTFDARPIKLLKLTGLNYIKAHFPEYLWYHFIRLPRLFTDSGYPSILNGVSALHFSFDSSGGGFLDEVLDSPQKAWESVHKNKLYLILLVSDLFFFVVGVLALAQPILASIFKNVRKEHVLLWIVLVLYTGLASPIGGARLRIPFNIIIFLLAFDGLAQLKRKYFLNNV